MANSEANGIAIATPGMHRSGMSLMTRVVNRLGAYLGEDDDVMQARPDNPEGLWEHRSIYSFYEPLPAMLHRNRDTAFPLPSGWRNAPEVLPLQQKLTELIE